MVKYQDKVQSSLQKLRAVLQARGVVEFHSELTEKQDNQRSYEIINSIIQEIQNFLVGESDCEIDQVSGRIETKLAELGADGVSITDESLEKIAAAVISEITGHSSGLNISQIAGNVLSAGRDVIHKLLNSLKWGKKPKKDDIPGQIVYILNNINKDKRLQDFKDYLKKLSDDAKKDAPQSEWTPERIEKSLRASSFFDRYMKSFVLMPSYMTWMYGWRVKQGFDHPFLIKLGQKIAKLSISMAEFALNLDYNVFCFVDSNIFKAEDDLTLRASELSLSFSELSLRVSNIMLDASKVVLSTASVSFLTAQTTSLVGTLVSVVVSAISIFTSTLSAMCTMITSVFSLATSIASSMLSMTLSASTSILSALLSLSVSVIIYLVPFFAAAGVLVLGVLMSVGYTSIVYLATTAALALAFYTVQSLGLSHLGMSMILQLTKSSVLGIFMSIVFMPLLTLSLISVSVASIVFLTVASVLTASLITAVAAMTAAVLVGIVPAIAVMTLASAVSAAALLVLSAAIGLIAMVLILFALMFLTGDTDFVEMITDFIQDTPIYQWYQDEVQSRGGFGGYLMHHIKRAMSKVSEFKQSIIDMVTGYIENLWIYKWWTEDVIPVGGLWEWIKFKFTEVVEWVSNPLRIWDTIKRNIIKMWGWMCDFSKSFKQAISDWWNSSTVKSVLDAVYNYAVKTAEKLKSAVDVGCDFIKWAARCGAPDPAAEAAIKASNETFNKNAMEMTKRDIESFIKNAKNDISKYQAHLKFLAGRIKKFQSKNQPELVGRMKYMYDELLKAVTKIQNDQYQSQVKAMTNIEQLKKNLEFYRGMDLSDDPKNVQRITVEENIKLLEQRISELETKSSNDAAEIESKSQAATDKLEEDSRRAADTLNAQDARMDKISSSDRQEKEPEIVPYPVPPCGEYDGNIGG